MPSLPLRCCLFQGSLGSEPFQEMHLVKWLIHVRIRSLLGKGWYLMFLFCDLRAARHALAKANKNIDLRGSQWRKNESPIYHISDISFECPVNFWKTSWALENELLDAPCLSPKKESTKSAPPPHQHEANHPCPSARRRWSQRTSVLLSLLAVVVAGVVGGLGFHWVEPNSEERECLCQKKCSVLILPWEGVCLACFLISLPLLGLLLLQAIASSAQASMEATYVLGCLTRTSQISKNAQKREKLYKRFLSGFHTYLKTSFTSKNVPISTWIWHVWMSPFDIIVILKVEMCGRHGNGTLYLQSLVMSLP